MTEKEKNKIIKKITPELDKKWRPKFERQAVYIGNGIYHIGGTDLYSTDTRELFIMFFAVQENIPFKKT